MRREPAVDISSATLRNIITLLDLTRVTDLVLNYGGGHAIRYQTDDSGEILLDKNKQPLTETVWIYVKKDDKA